MAEKKSGRIIKPPHKPRFGIGEWFGKSVIRMTKAERKLTAIQALNHVVPRKPKNKREIEACRILETECPRCPFQRASETEFRPCTKKGGVCSLRLYQFEADGSASRVAGSAGELVTLCPYRFNQDGIVFEWVGERILNLQQPPFNIGQVRFLKRIQKAPVETQVGAEAEAEEAEEEAPENVLKEKEDVGNIDNVLVDPSLTFFNWCALEIQAVYFSGEKMRELFVHMQQWDQATPPFPDRGRRPDFRSSGPKRLMPQLQIKVPTLRRWGKKMAVVIDEQFFRSLGRMEPVPGENDISNADVAWFVVGFDETQDPARLTRAECYLTTLERAVEGLTNGIPVSLSAFEARIKSKLEERGFLSTVLCW